MKQGEIVEKIESPASTRNREPILNELKKIIKKHHGVSIKDIRKIRI